MKKLLTYSLTCSLIVALALFCAQVSVQAEELQAQQTQEATDVKGAIVIKKQPTQENATQVQKVEKIYGSIVILVQGKCPFDKTQNAEK